MVHNGPPTVQKAFLHSTSQYIYLDLEKAMGFVETFADSLKEMPPAPMGEALRPLWSEALADIKAEHEAGADGQAVAQRIAEAMDAVVLSIYRNAMPQTSGPHALVALGGYGRCEMAPHSDVDLLFLFAKSQDKVPEVVAGVFNPLWDLGFEVGHSSRTLDEVVRAVREDLESRTAMMDGRLLAGDAALFAQFQQRLYKRVPKRTITELNRLRQQQLEARQSVQLLEPNVKESPGGLREIQMFEWALKAKAKAPECGDLCVQYLDGGSESLAKQPRLPLASAARAPLCRGPQARCARARYQAADRGRLGLRGPGITSWRPSALCAITTSMRAPCTI